MNFDNTRKTPNSAQYQKQHKWVKEQLGNADHCSNDSSHESTRYDWSNISKDYLSDLSDWQQLCRRCHRAYDPITEDGRKRIIQANKVNSKGNQYHATPVIMEVSEGSWIKFPSSKKAQYATGVLYSAISNVLTGRAKRAGGYKWRRVAS